MNRTLGQPCRVALFRRMTREEIVAALDTTPRTIRRDWNLPKG